LENRADRPRAHRNTRPATACTTKVPRTSIKPLTALSKSCRTRQSVWRVFLVEKKRPQCGGQHWGRAWGSAVGETARIGNALELDPFQSAAPSSQGGNCQDRAASILEPMDDDRSGNISHGNIAPAFTTISNP
jgi:hypothetical protein